MRSQVSEVTSGWPFLVGPGRRRDFGTLLAPDFLVTERAYGVLTDLVSAPDDGTITVLPITSLGGRRLTLVFRTHLVTAADLADASTGGRPGTSTAARCDWLTGSSSRTSRSWSRPRPIWRTP